MVSTRSRTISYNIGVRNGVNEKMGMCRKNEKPEKTNKLNRAKVDTVDTKKIQEQRVQNMKKEKKEQTKQKIRSELIIAPTIVAAQNAVHIVAPRLVETPVSDQGRQSMGLEPKQAELIVAPPFQIVAPQHVMNIPSVPKISSATSSAISSIIPSKASTSQFRRKRVLDDSEDDDSVGIEEKKEKDGIKEEHCQKQKQSTLCEPPFKRAHLPIPVSFPTLPKEEKKGKEEKEGKKEKKESIHKEQKEQLVQTDPPTIFESDIYSYLMRYEQAMDNKCFRIRPDLDFSVTITDCAISSFSSMNDKNSPFDYLVSIIEFPMHSDMPTVYLPNPMTAGDAFFYLCESFLSAPISNAEWIHHHQPRSVKEYFAKKKRRPSGIWTTAYEKRLPKSVLLGDDKHIERIALQQQSNGLFIMNIV